ncbi:BrnT family toxin [bacterium]|nr:MAG: BrnT family toxin [bacterium]
MEFEWDDEKAAANLVEHGVSFEEATEVFIDPIAVTFDDPDHSDQELREITVGKSQGRVILTVSHTDRDGNVRIISARLANRKEEQSYGVGRKRNAR